MSNPGLITNRRRFLQASAGALAVPWATKGAAATAKPTPRRLLFNWDGSMIHCFGRAALKNSNSAMTREEFASLIFTPLAENNVDAIMFSFGNGNVAEYQSHVLQWPGEADRFEFPAAQNWHGGIEVDPADQYQNPKSLADAGHNPPAIVVEECHRRGIDAFISLRMNDCHDGQHPKGSLPNPELAIFKRQNPDWLVEDLDWWSALDYRNPRVRALKLRVIEEFFDRWDFDGIELDWLRHTLYFPRGTEQENAHYLTDFMRQVRQSLQERAQRRGRAIEVAVRVPERVAWCEEGGFDLPTWISEDLIDLAILGQGLTELPTLTEFHNLMQDRKIPLYPCLTPFGNGYRLSPDEVIRGSAANLQRDGADGIYTFNWFFHGDWRHKLLRDIAHPDQLAGQNKIYTLTHKLPALFLGPGGPGNDYIRYNTQHRAAALPLRVTPKNSPQTVSIPVGPEFGSSSTRPARAELWLALDFMGKSDHLELMLNQQLLTSIPGKQGLRLETVGQQIQVPPGSGLLGMPLSNPVDVRFEAVRVEVPVEMISPGSNMLSITLHERTPGLKHELRVNRVELATWFN